jgi:nucleotide-binding universal stress UspA family protein
VRIRSILVPTDFSASSEVAVDYAVQLAKTLASKIHLIHAYAVEVPMYPEMPYALPESLIESVRQGAKGRLEAVAKRVSEAGVPCESHLSPEYPAAAVLDLASSLPADLIVMGTRGLTGFKHVALGSVAERTVRLAPCPVLTVKAEDR